MSTVKQHSNRSRTGWTQRAVQGLAFLALAFGGPAFAEAAETHAPAAAQRFKAATTTRVKFGEVSLEVTPPAGWQTLAETGASTRTSFYSPDSKTILTVRIEPERAGSAGPLSDRLRTMVSRRYTDAHLRLESSWGNQDLRGRAVDFERPAQGGEAPTTTRLAVACVEGAQVQVLFTTPTSRFFGNIPVCERFLGSMKLLGGVSQPAAPQVATAPKP